MAAIAATNTPRRHVLGDYAVRHYDLSGTNGDTFIPTPQQDIAFLAITPTTAIAVGATISGQTITFVTVGAWAARVAVFSRVG